MTLIQWLLYVGAVNIGFVLGVWWAKNWMQQAMAELWAMAEAQGVVERRQHPRKRPPGP